MRNDEQLAGHRYTIISQSIVPAIFSIPSFTEEESIVPALFLLFSQSIVRPTLTFYSFLFPSFIVPALFPSSIVPEFLISQSIVPATFFSFFAVHRPRSFPSSIVPATFSSFAVHRPRYFLRYDFFTTLSSSSRSPPLFLFWISSQYTLDFHLTVAAHGPRSTHQELRWVRRTARSDQACHRTRPVGAGD